MNNRKVPDQRSQWKCEGSIGQLTIWQAGENDYRITKGPEGSEIANRRQLVNALAFARRMQAIDDYYKDRNASGLAALAK